MATLAYDSEHHAMMGAWPIDSDRRPPQSRPAGVTRHGGRHRAVVGVAIGWQIMALGEIRLSG
ncbi:MAG: hypothetical protein O7G83_10605, partial [Proteobacteria bacterium]|nr:hypothetical protein [Pseudomonadota bacterium]